MRLARPMLGGRRRRYLISVGILALLLALLLVLLLSALHSNPTNTLSRMIRDSDRVVITIDRALSHELGLQDYPSFLTLTTDHEKSELAQLIQCESEVGLTRRVCACSGYPLIRIEKTGDAPRTISVHHGKSVRLDRYYTSNYSLTPRSERALAEVTRELARYAEYFSVHGEEAWNSYYVYEIQIKGEGSAKPERVFYGPSAPDDPRNAEFAAWLRSVYPPLRELECERSRR